MQVLDGVGFLRKAPQPHSAKEVCPPVDAKIVLLPGDGIGPEVVAQAERVLRAIAQNAGHRFEFVTCAIGGAAIDATGDPLPQETLAECRSAEAILLGAVGG